MRLHLHEFETRWRWRIFPPIGGGATLDEMRQNRVMDTLEPGAYVHFKGGRYDVVGEARHSETEERVAVYRSADGSLWIRPLDMFLGDAVVDGVAVPRFTKL